MSEQSNSPELDDAARHVRAGSDDDTQGHARREADDDDTQGHVRK